MPVDPVALVGGPGGWAVAVATWMAIGIGLVRKWWVPGWIYEKEVVWRERMTVVLEKLARRPAPKAPSRRSGG